MNKPKLITPSHERLRGKAQYLNREFDQRGLFGTAAALRVLGEFRDNESISLLSKLVHYLSNRPDIERSLATDPLVAGNLGFRLSVEEYDSFKTADLVYALSHVPATITGRDAVLRTLLDRIHDGRDPDGGWRVSLRYPSARSALATAHLLRALHAAGLPLDDADTAPLKSTVRSGDPAQTPFARMFILLVLVRIGAVSRHEARSLLARLETEVGDSLRPAEANYEYTVKDRQHYVRIPWQLYLIELVFRLHTGGRFFHRRYQRQLLDVAVAVESPEGFVYQMSGEAQSTRTYAIVFDVFTVMGGTLGSAPYVQTIGKAINWATRAAYSRLVTGLLWLGALGLVVWPIAAWVTDPDTRVGEVAPNFLATAVLVLVQVLLARLKR